MPRLAWSVAIPLSLLASSVLADVAPVAAPMALGLGAVEHVCSGAFAPQAWRDASDALFFASGPTSRLDQHEMWAGALVPLLAVRYLAGTLRVLVLGVPTQTQLRFTRAGWRPRWPLC
jgi:hypothetical protein